MLPFRARSLKRLLAASALVAYAPVSAAEPSKADLAAAKDLFARAERDEDAGRWADAVEKLRRAGAVKMTPGIRFRIADCEEHLGQLLAALADYNAAEAAARAEGNKEVLDMVSSPLAELRARVPTLTITAAADAKDAAVTVDGAALAPGLIGAPFPVEVGAHTVEARALGRDPFSATVTAAEAQTVTLEVRFPPSPGAVAAASGSAVAVVGSAPSSSNRTLAIGAAAGAAALVGFGVAAYVVAGGKQSDAEAACITLTSCDDLKGGVRTWDALALGSWIAAGGLAAVSVWLWTHPPVHRDGAARTRLDVGPGSVRLQGEF